MEGMQPGKSLLSAPAKHGFGSESTKHDIPRQLFCQGFNTFSFFHFRHSRSERNTNKTDTVAAFFYPNRNWVGKYHIPRFCCMFCLRYRNCQNCYENATSRRKQTLTTLVVVTHAWMRENFTRLSFALTMSSFFVFLLFNKNVPTSSNYSRVSKLTQSTLHRLLDLKGKLSN